MLWPVEISPVYNSNVVYNNIMFQLTTYGIFYVREIFHSVVENHFGSLTLPNLSVSGLYTNSVSLTFARYENTFTV